MSAEETKRKWEDEYTKIDILYGMVCTRPVLMAELYGFTGINEARMGASCPTIYEWKCAHCGSKMAGMVDQRKCTQCGAPPK